MEEALKEAMELRRREVAENLEDEQELVETLLDVYNARLDSLTDRISEIATSIETTQVEGAGGRREVGWREVGGGRWVEGGGAAGGEGHASNPRATVHSVAAPTDAAPTDAARPTGGTQVTLELQLDNLALTLAR